MILGDLKNSKIIFSALSLIIFVLLNSAGDSEARPTNVSQSFYNDTVEWLGELEDPNSGGGQEGEIQAEKIRVVQFYTAEDNDAIEKSQLDLQESGIQDETSSVVEEADVQETQTSQNLSNARKARDASNACITRYEYRIYYNIAFRVAVCKQGCKRKNCKIIFSALSLIIFVLLNSAGDSEARPTNVSHSSYNDTVEWLRELEGPNSGGGQEGEIQAEKIRVVQIYTAEDNDAIEKSQPDLQESGIQDETSSVVEEADVQETQTSQDKNNSRKTRDASNACIARYEYRIYYNYNIAFRVAVCKQGCKRKVKSFRFSNGQTLAIVCDCYI
ncbi:hypothetical protein ACROYT_G002924 [Oculina patagonica]